MTKAKTPRPASTYRGARRNAFKRGARRNAFKRGERPPSHRWQVRPAYYGQRYTQAGTPVLPDGTIDGSFKGVVRANERVRQ